MEEKKKYYTPAQKKAIYKYRATHKDVQAKIFAVWKAKNAEHIKEYSSQYYQKNKERILERNRLRYALKSESESESEAVSDSSIIL
jgi:F420-0:gamma-glutamyl ligase-like protein